MKIYDTHAHYNDTKYDLDRDELFKRMFNDGVNKINLIGASFFESKAEKELAYKYKNVGDVPTLYYTVGDHPDEINSFKPESEEGVKYLAKLEELCKDENGNVDAVAIGEIGLDYFGESKSEDTYKNQAEWFIAEMNLAKKLKLPIVVHSRDACKDTFDIIKEHGKDLTGVIHCFAYEKEIALEYVKMGYNIGIGGVVTFKNGRKTKETVEAVPLTSIITETDCPWLAPVPHRGERNESTYIKLVIEEIARIKNKDVDEVYDILYENGVKAFNLH